MLFTDIVMSGGMTGVELAQEVRRRGSRVKILFTSGYAEPAVVTGGLLATGAGWLGKPYTIDDLQSKLRELLRNEHRRLASIQFRQPARSRRKYSRHHASS